MTPSADAAQAILCALRSEGPLSSRRLRALTGIEASSLQATLALLEGQGKATSEWVEEAGRKARAYAAAPDPVRGGTASGAMPRHTVSSPDFASRNR